MMGKMRYLKKFNLFLFCLLLFLLSIYNPVSPEVAQLPIISIRDEPVIDSIGIIKRLGNVRWISRCFRIGDGSIYFEKKLKSTDGGKTVTPHKEMDFDEIHLKGGAVFAGKGVFYAPVVRTSLVRSGIYSVNAWRSTDNLRTLQKEKVMLNIPGGPRRDAEQGEWFGIYVHRSIIEMADGSWVMTMYGNFENDGIIPQNKDAQQETKFMTRTFLVKSTDEGHTWHYLSSVAVPKSGDPIGEGFGEPAITFLDDGRLLCIMRTGHHYPLYSTWSSRFRKNLDTTDVHWT